MTDEENRRWLVKKRMEFWKDTAPEFAVRQWFDTIMLGSGQQWTPQLMGRQW